MSLIGFNPPVIVVPQGITVLFQNHDATEHTVNSIAGDTLNAVLPAGYHYLVTLTEQEVIPYHCLRHAWMNGVVVVA
jgi:plastocyanin